MRLGVLIKHLRSFLLQRVVSRKLTAVTSKHCVVLTYHRVLPQNEVTESVEPGMYVTPATLRNHIRFLKGFFNIIPIGEAEKFLTGACCKKIGKPCCVISFDDGWRDFYTHAWPVLQEEVVPAVVYLPTGLVGSEKRFWTDRLAQVLRQDNVHTLAGLFNDNAKKNVLNGVGSLERQLYRAIVLVKDYPYKQIEEMLNFCEQEAGITSGPQGRTFMNWDEIRELFASGLVSFGSHTVNHAILTTLPTVDAQAELDASRQTLFKEKVAENSVSFCYPNGNYNNDICRLIRDSGFSSAMTCDFGWNRIGDSMYSLKRISLHQDISCTKYLFAYRLTKDL